MLRCALSLLAFALSAGEVFAAAPPAPRGLDVDGREYAIVSNDLWDVSVNGGRLVPVREVRSIRTANESATGAYDRQDFGYIWAPRCVAAKTELVFTRTLFMPGPAVTFAADFFETTSRTPSADDQVIAATRIFINDRHAFSFKGSTASLPTQTKFYPGLFRHGLNTIEIRVTKRARQAGGIGNCFDSASPPRPVGIAFTLRGTFESDLWISEDSGATTERYDLVQPGSTITQEIGVRPMNLGRSGAYTGRVSLYFSAGTVKSFKLLRVQKKGPEIEDCKITVASQFQSRVDCALDRMPPDRRRQVELSAFAQITFHPSFSTADLYMVSEIVSRTPDPRPQNNGWRIRQVYCSPTSDNPKCPK